MLLEEEFEPREALNEDDFIKKHPLIHKILKEFRSEISTCPEGNIEALNDCIRKISTKYGRRLGLKIGISLERK